MKVFLFLALFSNFVFANSYMYSSPSLVSVTTLNATLPYPVSTSQLVMAQNNLRSYLLIQNSGTNAAYFSFGAPKAPSSTFILAAGGNYEPIYPPSNSIYMTVPTGAYVTILQGQ